MDMRLISITNSPQFAAEADAAGVDQIMVDLETIGKAERQGHLDTHKAAHTISDIESVARALTTAELVVRTNPLYAHSADEIDQVINAGAKRLMQPMFETVEQVRVYRELVKGRVPIILLVETPRALVNLRSILPTLAKGDQIHFGLNDLSLGMGLRNLFEVVSGRLLDGPAHLCRTQEVSFGIGGIARIGSGKIPAELVLSEHARLGSQAVILSRAFVAGLRTGVEFTAAVQHLRNVWASTSRLTESQLESNHAKFSLAVARVE